MRILTASATLTLMLAAASQAAPLYDGWNKYRTITINTAATNGGAGVNEAVTDFPVLVRLTNAGINSGANALAEAKAGGADIRFTNEAGDTPLSYEIERWTANGADVWVRVPSVAANGSTVIRMYWGNSAASSESNGPAVFDSTKGFTAVWHMNGAGSGGQVDEQDATGGGLTATQFNSSGSHAASADEGGVGYYRNLVSDGSTGQGFVTNNPARANFLSTTNYTISAWVRPTSVEHTAYPVIVSKHDNLWTLRANTNMAGPWLFFYGNSGSWPEAQSSEMAVPGQWTHVVGVRSQTPNAMSIYVNGVLTGSTEAPPSGASQPTNTSVAIGRMAEAEDRFWNGAIAEVRAQHVARSSAWIKLEYETSKPGATALTLGPTQSLNAAPLFYPTSVAAYARNVAIDTNKPVLTGTATSFSISPTTLPAGLNFNTTTGAFSGTPTTLAAAQKYIVTANLQGGGTATDSVTISVVAGQVPGAPASITAVGGNGQAIITWTPPLTTGTGPVTGYTVKAVQDASKECTWTSGPLTCTVTGLTNGTPYTFTVTATNGAGTGAASAPSLTVTPVGVPGAPTGVTAVLASGAGTTPSVRVSWTAPTSTGGGEIFSYTVTSNPAGGTCTAFGGLTCTINAGLTYGTAYTFTVVGSNIAGSGTASQPSASFTPVGLLPGSFTIQQTGAARPFTFVLTEEAIKSTESFTLSIVDAWGRTVWSQGAHPARDGTRTLTWNGRTSAGHPAAPGVYVVRVSTKTGATATNFVQKSTLP